MRRRVVRRFVAAGVVWMLGACGASPATSDIPEQTPTAFRDGVWGVPADTRDAVLAAMRFSDPNAWDAAVEDGDAVLTLRGGSKYTPPVRSPLNLALFDVCAFKDFVLDVELQQTGREYGHRDLCLVFGHQAPDRFYYVHLASAADQNAHNVFLVDGAPRRPIATATTDGVQWGSVDAWHAARLVRKGRRIEVYFDDLLNPIMTADDATFGAGRIGFGSFDDSGRFRRIRVVGDAMPKPDAEPFAH